MSVPVTVVPYDPDWPRQFEAEKQALLAAIGEHVVAIEHMGSTAVPGLAAKPILDILVGLRDLEDARACIAPLAALGYEYHPEFEDQMPERRYFRRATPEAHTHHLHMWVHGGEGWTRHLRFRDILRAHPEVLEDYQALKQRLAEQYRHDRHAYTDAKTEFVESALARYGPAR